MCVFRSKELSSPSQVRYSTWRTSTSLSSDPENEGMRKSRRCLHVTIPGRSNLSANEKALGSSQPKRLAMHIGLHKQSLSIITA
jgi:hypothetical protein